MALPYCKMTKQFREHWFFYTANIDSTNDALNRLKQMYPTYDVQAIISEDRAWTHYKQYQKLLSKN